MLIRIFNSIKRFMHRIIRFGSIESSLLNSFSSNCLMHSVCSSFSMCLFLCQWMGRNCCPIIAGTNQGLSSLWCEKDKIMHGFRQISLLVVLNRLLGCFVHVCRYKIHEYRARTRRWSYKLTRWTYAQWPRFTNTPK